MKKAIAWLPCLALYYVAHWSYLILDDLPDDQEEEPNAFWRAMWFCYQRGMAASLKINDWAGLRVWMPAE